GHLGDHLQQLLAAAALVFAHRGAEGFHHAVQRRAGLLEDPAALQAAVLGALGQALLQTALIAFGAADFQPLLAAFLEAALQALLIALAQRALQRGGVGARRVRTVARHPAMPGGKAVDAPAAGVASNHTYRHGPTCHSTVCSRNSWICNSPSAAISRTMDMMSLRTCSTRLTGTGPWRRLMVSICWAWRRGMALATALTSSGSAPLSATTHSSSGTTSSRVCSTSWLWRARMKKSYICSSMRSTSASSWLRSSSNICMRSPLKRFMMSATCFRPRTCEPWVVSTFRLRSIICSSSAIT